MYGCHSLLVRVSMGTKPVVCFELLSFVICSIAVRLVLCFGSDFFPFACYHTVMLGGGGGGSLRILKVINEGQSRVGHAVCLLCWLNSAAADRTASCTRLLTLTASLTSCRSEEHPHCKQPVLQK